MSKRAKVAVLEALRRRLAETTVCSSKWQEATAAYIATHHGSFHADEVMACTMLKLLPQYQGLPILRTRDTPDLDAATIVVDVGATYEPEKQRYDHHQSTFTTTYGAEYTGIKLSSAGLVFKHFGADVVKAICGDLKDDEVSLLVAKVYDSLIRELDAIDNGVEVGTDLKYKFVTHFSARVKRLNPSWQEETSPELESERFKAALDMAAGELVDVVCGYAFDWLPARSIVADALRGAEQVHPSGKVLKLGRFCPWQEHLFDIEESGEVEGSAGRALYVLFADSRGSWRIQAVPQERGSFGNRKPLLAAWRGLRDAELSKVAGIEGCVFIHASGFIGGHANEAGALALAIKSVEG